MRALSGAVCLAAPVPVAGACEQTPPGARRPACRVPAVALEQSAPLLLNLLHDARRAREPAVHRVAQRRREQSRERRIRLPLVEAEQRAEQQLCAPQEQCSTLAPQEQTNRIWQHSYSMYCVQNTIN